MDSLQRKKNTNIKRVPIEEEIQQTETVFEPVNRISIDEIWSEDVHIPKIKDQPNNFIRWDHKLQAKLYAWEKTKTGTQLTVFCISLLLFALILQGGKVISSSLNVRSQVLGVATEALSNLQEAEALAKEQNFVDSLEQFQLAQQNFIAARNNLSVLGKFFGTALFLTEKGTAAKLMLDAGQEISLAGISMNHFYELASQINVSAGGFSAPQGFYNTLNSSEEFLVAGSKYLDSADNKISQVDAEQLPNELRPTFEQYKDQLVVYADGLREVKDLINLLKVFVGPGQKSVLVLFENNDELRPTGGFIGTYGFFKLNDGQIVKQTISSVYDLDGQLSEKIAPPGPFHDLTDTWGLRDSNWFVDFSKSAQKSSMFYEKVGMETPDAVIAITPDVFIDLLKIIGPVDFPKYGVTLDAGNFRETIQTDTSENYDKKTNTPKQMLADFAPLLLQQLSGSDNQSSTDLAALLVKNLNAKNILIYDRNLDVHKQLQKYNWTGEPIATEGDYLSINSANLGGTKTDTAIRQKVDFVSEVQNDGSVINTVTYFRTLDSSKKDKNISYVRFLVPMESTLISSEGFISKPFFKSDGTDYPWNPANSYITDSDLLDLDKSSSIDARSGTVINIESGKRVFANWMEVKPGETQTVKLIYRTNLNLNDTRKYSLVYQKQPGSSPIDFSYSLNSGRGIVWYTPYDLSLADGKMNYVKQLDSDLFLGTVFAKQ